MNHTQKLKNVVPSRFHPYLGEIKRRLRSRPARTRRQWQRLLADPALSDQERELLKQVETRISPGDGMYSGDGAHYFKVGLSAIGCLDVAIDAAGLDTVKRILDLPCGHGRVLRFLVLRFPEARFTASDLDRKGVDFCVRVFGVEGVYSQLDLPEFSLDTQFDLIWCGSLITHLNETGIRGLLSFFARHLSSGGLMIFTTHGERVIQRLLNRTFDYGIANENIPAMIDDYRKDGFGFTDYPRASDYGVSGSGYGVSLTTPEWIRAEAEKLGLNEVYFCEHGWDDHQDVYGFVRQS
jgi:SAM-dependent methyltransferase